MHTSDLVKYYSQEGFIEFMLSFSKEREVVPRYRDKFGTRPQTFRFKGELLDTIRKGASSFHFSEEHWINPTSLTQNLTIKELNSLRNGWDLIFDIDTKKLKYAKTCAKLIIDALKFHDIEDISIKFSGGTGFHIGISFNKPEYIEGVKISNLFPEAPRIIGFYIQELIKEPLQDELISYGITGDPFKIVNIDPIAIAPRHLIRAPYSFNEKKWLISLPINKEDLADFSTEKAIPEKVDFSLGFLNKKTDATELFRQAFDWKKREEKKKTKITHNIPKSAVNKDKFPPCIQNILKGLSDGRKRALFVLINFYNKCGYSWELINNLINEWNTHNNPPLRKSYVESQIKWSQKQGGLMPPNCSSPNYKDIGVCKPDNLCYKIKNPVIYALHKNKFKKHKRKPLKFNK